MRKLFSWTFKMRKHSKFTELLFSVLFFFFSLQPFYFFFFTCLALLPSKTLVNPSFYFISDIPALFKFISFITFFLSWKGLLISPFLRLIGTQLFQALWSFFPIAFCTHLLLKPPRPHSMLVSALCAFHLADALLWCYHVDSFFCLSQRCWYSIGVFSTHIRFYAHKNTLSPNFFFLVNAAHVIFIKWFHCFCLLYTSILVSYLLL